MGQFLAGTIDICVDDVSHYAAFRVDADAKFNVSHQAIVSSRFVEREVEDIGEAGGRRPTGLQAAYADRLILTAACKPGTANPICIDIAFDQCLTAGIARDFVVHLEFAIQANPFLRTRGSQSAIEWNPPGNRHGGALRLCLRRSENYEQNDRR